MNRTKLNKGHLGFYQPGRYVVIGEWSFKGYPQGMVVPQEPGPYPARRLVILNCADTTGYVVVEHEVTKARTELDAYTPVTAVDTWGAV